MAKLQAGVPVTIQGGLATVKLDLLVPVPNVSDDQLEQALKGAVVMFVKSPRSGLTATFADALVVPRGTTPSDVNQFTFALNDARNQMTFTFFNKTASNLTLKPGFPYLVALQILPNDLIEAVSPVSFVANAQVQTTPTVP